MSTKKGTSVSLSLTRVAFCYEKSNTPILNCSRFLVSEATSDGEKRQDQQQWQDRQGRLSALERRVFSQGATRIRSDFTDGSTSKGSVGRNWSKSKAERDIQGSVEDEVSIASAS